MDDAREDPEDGAELLGPDRPPPEVIAKLVEMDREGKLDAKKLKLLERLRDERFQDKGPLHDVLVAQALEAHPGLSPEAAPGMLEAVGG